MQRRLFKPATGAGLPARQHPLRNPSGQGDKTHEGEIHFASGAGLPTLTAGDDRVDATIPCQSYARPYDLVVKHRWHPIT